MCLLVFRPSQLVSQGTGTYAVCVVAPEATKGSQAGLVLAQAISVPLAPFAQDVFHLPTRPPLRNVNPIHEKHPEGFRMGGKLQTQGQFKHQRSYERQLPALGFALVGLQSNPVFPANCQKRGPQNCDSSITAGVP